MGSVGDRVGGRSRSRSRSLLLKLECLTVAFFQGLPGFRGKPGIAGIIGKTVSLSLVVLRVEEKLLL